MDRRNWPWRKKSSEKSPGETESSGSISDEQANIIYNSQSPEVASTNAPDDEENEKINTLTDKLSAALLDISAKEDLVKQHAKVAEEAVAGWERAEKEASSYKLQLDAALKKISALDGALKECVRQLRQGKEEREQRIEEGIAKREGEWESRNSELESQLNELSTQLEAAKSRMTSSTSIDDLLPKLEAAERESSSMRIEMVGLKRKLEIASIERDLSTQSAETASKQQLECVKKVAKLEAECRKLRFLARKVDHRSVKAGSLTDSHSDCGETESNQSGARESERVLMDDFLEMEKLAAVSPEKSNESSNTTLENTLKAEIQELIARNADLEKNIRRLEGEVKELKGTKTELISLQNHLFECQDHLRKSQAKLKGTETELIELQTQLIEHEDQLKDADVKLEEMQSQLIERDDQLNISRGQLNDAEESLTEHVEQLKTCQEQVEYLEGELRKLETLLSEREDQLKISQEQLVEMQTRLIESQGQTKEVETKLIELQTNLALTEKLKEEVEEELKTSNGRRNEAELQVQALESEMKSLMDKVESLEHDLSAEVKVKYNENEDEVEPQFQLAWNCNTDMKAEQEKELAVAASKLEECKKTIASLGRQLQSLATLDDFLEEDEESSLDFSRESPIFFRTGELPSIDCQ